MKNRIWFLILGCAALLGAFLGIRSAILKANYSWKEPLPAETAAQYRFYLPDEASLRQAGTGNNPEECVLSLCEPEKEEQIGEQVYIYYRSDKLQNYLPLCREIQELYTNGNWLLVRFLTDDGRDVFLFWMGGALRTMLVYTEVFDQLYVYQPESPDETDVLWHNYRKGNP